MSDDDEDLFDVFADGGNATNAEVPSVLALTVPPEAVDSVPLAGRAVAQPQESSPPPPSENQYPHERHRASALPLGVLNPSSMPNGSTDTTCSSGGPSGLAIIHGASSAMSAGTLSSSLSSVTVGDPLKVHVERMSGIRVRRITRSFEQLAVRFAEYPFLPFDVASGVLKRQQPVASSATHGASLAAPPLPKTCVGVVVRKTDPKQGKAAPHSASRSNTYAVCTLWNMRGLSPSSTTSADEELALLLCGAAFELLYGQLAVGSVVSVSNLVALPMKKDGGDVGRQGSMMLRVAQPEDLRVLGYAADLTTCTAVTRQAGEPCHALVNGRMGKTCAYHVSATTRTGASAGSTKAASKKGLTTTMRIGSAPPGVPPLGTRPVLSSTTPLAAAPSRAHTQRLMHPQGFLAVSGASGLPVAGSGPTQSTSLAHTTYGHVQHAPLAKSRLTDLRLPASYPSAQALGVSSRGRQVLEATKDLEIHKEQERLLRQALHSKNPSSSAGTRAQPFSSPTDEGAQGQAGRKHGRDAANEVNPESFPPRKRPALPSSVKSVPSGLSGSTETKSSALAMAQHIREQFAPLQRSNTDSNFVPLSVHNASTEALRGASGSLSANRGSTSRVAVNGATRSAVVATVSKALRNKDDLLMRQRDAVQAGVTPSPGVCTPSGTKAPASLISAMADSVKTSHDVLIQEAEVNRVRDFLDQQIQKEAVLRSLEQQHEQTVMASYCHSCKEWYARVPGTCLRGHHRVVRRQTVRRFFACECCGYKMTFLGEDTKPWKLMPRCPRCAREITWEKSSAAPEQAKTQATAEE